MDRRSGASIDVRWSRDQVAVAFVVLYNFRGVQVFRMTPGMKTAEE